MEHVREGEGFHSAMEFAVACRLRIDPQKITAHCGLHIVELNRQVWIEPGSDGYFFRQTRFLSRFDIRSAGHAPKPVCCVNVEPHATVSYYLLPTPAGDKAAPPRGPDGGGEMVAKGIEVQINAFGGGWRLDVALTNRALADAVAPLSFLFDADFADADEVSAGKRRQTSEVRRSFAGTGNGAGELTFAYRHARLNHATCVRLTAPKSGHSRRRRGGLANTDARAATNGPHHDRSGAGFSRRGDRALVRARRGANRA